MHHRLRLFAYQQRRPVEIGFIGTDQRGNHRPERHRDQPRKDNKRPQPFAVEIICDYNAS